MRRSIKKYLVFAVALVLWGQLAACSEPALAALDTLLANSHKLANIPNENGVANALATPYSP